MDGKKRKGWIKLHRRILDSAAWKKGGAVRDMWIWLLLAAEPLPALRERNGKRLRIARGELVASIPNVAKETGFTEKQVRNGFKYLTDENMIKRDASRIQIVNYPLYQGTPEDAAPLHGEEGKDGEQAGRKKGQAKGQGGKRKKGRAKIGEKPLSRKKKHSTSEGERAGAKTKKGQTKGQALIRNKKLMRNKNPLTPFLPKGESPSSESSSFAMLGSDADRRRMVLAMWRDEREAAGLAYFEDKATVRAADKLAAEWLGKARMSREQLEKGMKKLIAVIKSERGCGNYTLNALALAPSKYCPPPPVEKAKRGKRISWRLICDVCGYESCTAFLPAAERPRSQPCALSARGCQGTMHPEIDSETE